MTVRDVRVWTCDVAGCTVTAEKDIKAGRDIPSPVHDLPTGWSSVVVTAIRGHHNVTKWLCPADAVEHIIPMFPEYIDTAEAGL